MSVEFGKSNTKINLMKAFAGESQARNRYTFAASIAKKEGLAVIEKVFNFTANQEKEHAKLFYNSLSKLCGEKILIQSDFPVNTYTKTLDHLKASMQGEYGEYDSVYKSFAEEAKAEGFDEISKLFSNIALIEKVHGDRYAKMAEYLEKGELFESSDENQRWLCLNCGNIHTGKFPPKECEVCKHPQGYFIRHDWILI